MKKVFVLFMIFCFSLVVQSFAQETDTTNRIVYCEIVGIGKMMSNKVEVVIDFGEFSKFFADNRLRDANGDVIVFNSMVDALNFMGEKQWKFQQAYVVTVSTGMGVQNVYHFMLSKEISKEEYVNFFTKKDFK